jgi:hypothetical protein
MKPLISKSNLIVKKMNYSCKRALLEENDEFRSFHTCVPFSWNVTPLAELQQSWEEMCVLKGRRHLGNSSGIGVGRFEWRCGSCEG